MLFTTPSSFTSPTAFAGVGVTVGGTVTVIVGVSVLVGVAVMVGVTVTVAVTVLVGVGVIVRVIVAVAVTVLVGVVVIAGVPVIVIVAATVAVPVVVGVSVSAGVAVIVGAPVSVATSVGSGVSVGCTVAVSGGLVEVGTGVPGVPATPPGQGTVADVCATANSSPPSATLTKVTITAVRIALAPKLFCGNAHVPARHAHPVRALESELVLVLGGLRFGPASEAGDAARPETPGSPGQKLRHNHPSTVWPVCHLDRIGDVVFVELRT